jgi:hypothetical protein
MCSGAYVVRCGSRGMLCLFVEGRMSAKVGSILGLSFLRNADGLFIFLFCVADFLKV